MRGSITRLNKKIGCGFILGEDGCEAYFDISSLEGIDIRGLSIGKLWNIRNTLGTSGCGLTGSRSYRTLEANPQVGVELFLLPPIPFASLALGTETSFFLAHAEDWLSSPVKIPCMK